MLNLILTITGLTAFVHLMKFAQARRQRIWAVAAVNYVFAALASAVLWYGRAGAQLPALAIVLGAVVGAGYVGTFALLNLGIAGSGVALAAAVSRLSVLIPIVASLYWDEIPNTFQIVGILLILVALPLIGTRPAQNPQASRRASFVALAVLFILGGAWQVAMKVVSQAKGPASIHTYNTVLFATAAVVSVLVAAAMKEAPRLRELATGALLGGSNLLSNLPMLIALQAGPGAIVFSTRTSAAVVLTVLLSVVIWRERLSARSLVGVATAVVALVLVNIRVGRS